MTLRLPSRTACTLTVGLALLVATTIFAQQASTGTTQDQKTAILVSQMISKFHISQRQIDDKISALLLKRFLKDRDPFKLYYLQRDIDEGEIKGLFRRRRTEPAPVPREPTDAVARVDLE